MKHFYVFALGEVRLLLAEEFEALVSLLVKLFGLELHVDKVSVFKETIEFFEFGSLQLL